ncbi:hypothetical protein HU200_025149 [Digitaria exilis]|uniref:WAT1-related protein n=1 Tax=Digitaria exilis TaxID=1010633 RepID=A0A835C0K0_9POAL|nr:hypothetical protein HU200_025149 [Digitaria exilis]
MSGPDVKELSAQATQPPARSANSGGWKPALCVVLSEVFNTGTVLLSKVAIDSGTFVFSLLFYRSILGAVFTLPFALFFESGKWKDLDKGALGWLFLNAFTGMEKLRLRSKEGNSKVTGVLVCFGGALLISLYKGKVLLLFRAIVNVEHKSSNGIAGRHHLRGTLLLLGNCISYACWYPVQVKVLGVYPWKHWSSVVTCFFGGLQTFAMGIIVTRDKLAWQIGWNIQLLTIVYAAALGTAAKYWLNLYAVEHRGPVYPPMFSTLSAVFIIILGTLLLGESLTVGSLLGSFLVLSGLYIYLYGKAKEPQAKTTPGSMDKELQMWPTRGSASEDTISGP